MSDFVAILKKLIPAEHVNEVVKAIESMVAERVAKVEADFNAKLQEAYDTVSAELAEAEAIAEAGYQQAYDLIMDQQLRIEAMQEEFDNAIDEGYEEAWEMLKAEESKNKDIEVEIYKEFDQKLRAMNDFYVEKIDAFLQLQNAEIYEHARRDILNDPRMVEHKVALDKIVEVAAAYLSEEDFQGATSGKLEEAYGMVQKMREDLRVLEARNVRISTQNTRLQEQVREMHGMMSESTQVERRERARTARSASGRGQRVLGNEQVIAEYNNPQTRRSEDDQSLIESNDVLNDLLVLSGLKQAD
jgi:hypothetical protein